jgi:GR25 family glycosyltransferase involved in LPS biosynthesis
MDTIQDIKHAFYINLASRPDRKVHVETQLQNIGINATRFNAIRLTNGALGCSMSHLKCVETAKKMEWPHVLIVEDDILFLDPSKFVTQLSNCLSRHKNWDVILLAGNNVPPYKRIDDTCIRVSTCQTTTGYIVKSHYYDTLIANFREGIKQLMVNPEQHVSYAIDKYWFQLQRRDRWYLIIPLSVTQREDYSDIEKRPINYRNVMLDLDKESYIKTVPQPQPQPFRPQMNLLQDIK